MQFEPKVWKEGMSDAEAKDVEPEFDEQYPVFFDELSALINRFSLESESHTPDFILAEYMGSCLAAFNRASQERERWYGRGLRINGEVKTSGPYDNSNVTAVYGKLKPKRDHKTPPEPKTLFAEKPE